ncbi:unnamed protein product [Paramecium octaurelia]|uniref:Uncharacterized protein n=1 Tax=Paramecium octaurelia TaxID=43137 RepID=A0A8S1WJF1_PAROT|nr:unnamed protein product [Paramecium octaurelia]
MSVLMVYQELDRNHISFRLNDEWEDRSLSSHMVDGAMDQFQTLNDINQMESLNQQVGSWCIYLEGLVNVHNVQSQDVLKFKGNDLYSLKEDLRNDYYYYRLNRCHDQN